MSTTLSITVRLVLAAVLALTGSAHASERIAVFGDSLSDAGNVFTLSGEVSTRPYNASNIPDAPYPIGGLHFSNGPTWIEQVGKALQQVPDTEPALRAPGVFHNYAFGGARARDGGSSVPSLSGQVGLYLGTVGTPADDTLHVMFIGGNDVRDAISAFLAAGPAAATQVLTEAITAIADNIQTLAGAGATRFMVANAPDLGTVPAITALGPQAIVLASSLSDAFNTELENTLASLEFFLGISVLRLDVAGILGDVIADPAAFGLVNVTDSCLTPEVRAGAICRHPDDYLFWDAIHPTRATHAVLAREALDVLGQSHRQPPDNRPPTLQTVGY